MRSDVPGRGRPNAPNAVPGFIAFPAESGILFPPMETVLATFGRSEEPDDERGKTPVTSSRTGAVPKRLRRCSASEPTIGHMKNGARLPPSALRGTEGDAVCSVRVGCGHTIGTILGHLRARLHRVIRPRQIRRAERIACGPFQIAIRQPETVAQPDEALLQHARNIQSAYIAVDNPHLKFTRSTARISRK
ncbi:hypothetical protein [Sedimentitalea nanhaiensis]|uniref:Uncharacterized protein n=1 Tax=Sedimentitalea nanhaiensis TaxID=999627 RepID=A0A1I7BI85_9RHOB|nr:hypothetical protein [Sedimentitalea nanhaiensis]SFT86890.1 hypothetical protein SAMN05216236_11079 [Sedimentitalea nanhaiensis]